MPYYRRMLQHDKILSSSKYYYGGAYSSQQTGHTVRSGIIETSFRTVPPQGTTVKEIAQNVAEPYSWFVDLQNLKIQASIKEGFDKSVFRVDTGHPWELERYDINGIPWNFSWSGGADRYDITGAFPTYESGDVNPGFWYPLTGLESWAALQYGRMAPSVSEFSLTTFLGELREGLPRILPGALKGQVNTLRQAGGDYLNVEFGWKPLINDLRSLAEVLLSASYGLYRPFGASHRERKPPASTFYKSTDGTISQEIQYQIGHQGINNSALFLPTDGIGHIGSSNAKGLVRTVRKSSVKRWIEGEFVYIPKASFDMSKYQSRVDSLMSLDLTPSTLWELSPWSWLVDWFIDLGGAIQSMEAATTNRVISTYCYAMEETKSSISSSVTILGSTNPFYTYNGPKQLNHSYDYVRKRRIRANPFGFLGSPSTTLNGGQMAILGALGLTKLR